MRQDLIGFILDKVQRAYNSRGFPRFGEYREEILAGVDRQQKGEAATYLGLIESELNRRNKGRPSARIFEIGDDYKKHLELVLKDKVMLANIESGVVIDHLHPDVVFDIALVLGLKGYADNYYFGKGFSSTHVSEGRKAVLKIEGKVLSDKEIALIRLIDEGATINTIKDGKVVDKKRLSEP